MNDPRDEQVTDLTDETGEPLTASNWEGAPPAEHNKPSLLSRIREWADAIVFAVVIMLIVRTFVFDLFRIPSPSMEKTLLVGDYLFVSKLHYGTRTPVSIGIPFTQTYWRGMDLPYFRLPGFTKVRRGDAVVFNYPPEEKPIDRKLHYIKRVVGLPGDTIRIVDKVVYVDGVPQGLKPTMQQLYLVAKKDAQYDLPEARLTELGIDQLILTGNPLILRLYATPAAAREIESWPGVERVTPFIAPVDPIFTNDIYPAESGFTPDNWGPATLPRKGVTVDLTFENWPLYEPVIRKFEGHTTDISPDGSYMIDGKVATRYTFQKDYYFMMGDNRDDSQDSRYWGFVPFDHIVGKAVFIYFSVPEQGGLPRFERMFRGIR